MIAEQLDFFQTEEERMTRRIDQLALSNDKVRKKVFTQTGALNKIAMDHEARLEIIERFICQQGKQ